MSNMQQNFDAGETKGQTQVKAEEWIQSAKDTANAAGDAAVASGQSAQQSAQQTRDETSNFFQQTGEQVKSMAQGAVEGVKNTLGMGDSQSHK